MPHHDPTPRQTLAEPAELQIVGGPFGSILDATDEAYPVCIVPPGGCDPRYWNLMRSVSIVHFALRHQLTVLDSLIDMAERAGIDVFTPAFLEAQTSIKIAQKIAREGVENVQEQIVRNPRT